MADTSRDLRGRYPFVYIGGDPDEDAALYAVSRHVLDARITVSLPAGSGDAGIVVRVISVPSTSVASMSMELAVTGAEHTGQARIYVGRDNSDMLATSPDNWVLVDDGFVDAVGAAGSWSVGGALQIHPSCLRMRQAPPVLYAVAREPGDPAEDATAGGAPMLDGERVPVTSVEDGNNVSVSLDGGTLSFVSYPGAGSGIWPTSAASMYGLESFDVLRKSGLRSINGLSGTVWIFGGGTVRVAADEPGRLSIRIADLDGGDG